MLFKKERIRGFGICLLVAMLFTHCSSISKKNKPIVLYKQQAIDWMAPLVGPKNKGILTSESYSDSLFSARFKLRPNLLSMEISSHISDSLYILWNECLIIFPDKTSSKVLHSRIPFEDRLQPLPMVLLEEGLAASYYIAPKNKLSWNLKNRHWRSFPLLEGSPRSIEGDKITFLLALHHKGTTLRYPFEFSVEKVLPITLSIKKPNKKKMDSQPPKAMTPENQKPPGPKPAIENSVPVVSPAPISADTPIQEEDILQDKAQKTAQKDSAFNPNQPQKKASTDSLPQKEDKQANLKPDSTAVPASPSQKGINNLLQKLEAKKKLYSEEEESLGSPEPTETKAEPKTEKTEAESSVTGIPIIDFTGQKQRKKPDSKGKPADSASNKPPKPLQGVRRSIGSI